MSVITMEMKTTVYALNNGVYAFVEEVTSDPGLWRLKLEYWERKYSEIYTYDLESIIRKHVPDAKGVYESKSVYKSRLNSVELCFFTRIEKDHLQLLKNIHQEIMNHDAQ